MNDLEPIEISQTVIEERKKRKLQHTALQIQYQPKINHRTLQDMKENELRPNIRKIPMNYL